MEYLANVAKGMVKARRLLGIEIAPSRPGVVLSQEK